jgi:uncharacterized RDD family membrane protein YckC
VAEPAGQRAGIARRLAATVYESLVLAALALLAGLLLLPVLGTTPVSGDRLPALTPAASVASFLVLFALGAGYCVWQTSGGRRTLPMQAWRLGLRKADGGLPSPARAICRYLAWWIGPACAIGAYLALRPLGHGRWALAAMTLNYGWALVDPDRQFLHDRLAGTRLVRV